MMRVLDGKGNLVRAGRADFPCTGEWGGAISATPAAQRSAVQQMPHRFRNQE